MTWGKHVYYSILIILLIAGGFFRFYNLSHDSYWMDEGYTVNAVISVVEHGETTLDSGLPYSCPTYCYPTAILVKIFGDSPAVYRSLSALAGVLFILLIFLLASRIFDKRVALVASFFTAFSYWQIAWSRQARWYTLFALFFWLAFYFFYKFLYDKPISERQKYFYLAFSLLFTLLSIFTHSLGYLLPLFFILWLGYEKVYREKHYRLGAALVACFVLVLFLARDLFGNITFFNLLPYYASFYLREYWLFLLLAIPAFIYREYRKPVCLLTALFFIYLIPLSFFTELLHYRYLFHATPILIILAGTGCYVIFQKIKSRYGQILFGTLVAIAFFISGAGVLVPQDNYFLEADDPEKQQGLFGDVDYFAYTPQPNWRAAYVFIQEKSHAGDIVISSHPHFNKIYLGEAGYWLKYPYLGPDSAESTIVNNREYYVGALVIDDLNELQTITAESNGFIVFDYMATDDRILAETLDFIETNFELVFHDKRNSYSQVWVYRF